MTALSRYVSDMVTGVVVADRINVFIGGVDSSPLKAVIGAMLLRCGDGAQLSAC